MYEVTVFIYDYVTDKTYKRGRALIFQPIPGMVYREGHTTDEGENHTWLADMVTIVADFQDCAAATSQGHVVVLSTMESDSLQSHQFAGWLCATGWVVTEPPKGIRFDGMLGPDDHDDVEESEPSEP